jgi:GPH family glycoside/pentoside/hexuronide:cation symporter
MAFGVGGLTAAFGSMGIKNLAIPVYQMTLKVDPALLGLMLAIPRFWDAFTDPFIGHLSDHTRSRFGRRRPYIVAGALLTGLTFALVWMVPVHWSQGAQLAWFLTTSLLFYTCYSIWEVPYQSLGYELTPNYHERTTVMGVQNLFSKGGVAVEWVFPLAQLGFFLSVMQGVRAITAALAVIVFMGFGLLPGLLIRERFAATGVMRVQQPRAGLWRACTATLRNRGMLVLMTLVLLNLVASMFTSGLDYYLLVYYVCGGDIFQGSMWKGVLSSTFAGVGFVSVWLLAWMSRRYDKRNALVIVYVMVAIGGVGKWFFFREGMPWLCLLVPLLCGPIFTANDMIAKSMIADICDEDELRHGERREGMSGAMHGWVGKTAAALAILGAGITLNVIGFDAARGAAQDPEALLRIRYILVVATVLPALIAIFVLRFYPLNAAKMTEIRSELERRRGTV